VGALHGVEAVVDKDVTAALLARALAADALVILTDVDAVEDGYGTPQARPIRQTTPATCGPGRSGDGPGPRQRPLPRVHQRDPGVYPKQGTDGRGRLFTMSSGIMTRPLRPPEQQRAHQFAPPMHEPGPGRDVGQRRRVVQERKRSR
jgi:carbamate kinase